MSSVVAHSANEACDILKEALSGLDGTVCLGHDSDADGLTIDPDKIHYISFELDPETISPHDFHFSGEYGED